MTIKAVTRNKIGALRKHYLDRAYEAQELFVEMMVNEGKYYLIESDDKEMAGYMIVAEEHIVVEFYLTDHFMPDCESIFAFCVKEVDAPSAFCKSFDPVLLKCCLSYFKSFNIIGALFRDRVKNGFNLNKDKSIKRRIATRDDISNITGIRDGLFDNDSEVDQSVNNNSMMVYEKEGDVIGYGLFQRICETRNYFDIGMLVNPGARRKGYGVHIIHDLAEFCDLNNWIPTCGCAVDNTASRKTLEHAGFISRHNLIEFNDPKS